MFYRILSSLVRSKYLFIFLVSLIFSLWSAGITKFTSWHVFFLFYFVFIFACLFGWLVGFLWGCCLFSVSLCFPFLFVCFLLLLGFFLFVFLFCFVLFCFVFFFVFFFLLINSSVRSWAIRLCLKVPMHLFFKDRFRFMHIPFVIRIKL